MIRNKFWTFYFRRDWVKASGLILLGLVSGNSPHLIPALMELKTYFIIVAGSLLLCFARILNDYYDATLEGEDNEIKTFIRKYKRSKVVFLLLLPLMAALIFIGISDINEEAMIAFLSFILLAVSYSVKGIRIRNRPILGFLWNPLLAVAIFDAAFLTFSKIKPEFWVLSLAIFFFYFFSEVIHQLAHYKRDKESGRKTIVTSIGIKATLSLVRSSPYIILPLGMIWIFLFLIKSRVLLLYSIMLGFNIWRSFFLRKKLSQTSSFNELRTRLGGKSEIVLYITYFIANEFIKSWGN